MSTIYIGSRTSAAWLAAGIMAMVSPAFGADTDSGAPAASSVSPTAADSSDAAQVMYLGDIKITGQKVIVAALQQIKVALDRPFDTSKEHENDVVCRISSDTGFREHQYLICASNKQFTRMRYEEQQKLLDANSRMGQKGNAPGNKVGVDDEVLLENLTAQNPDHVLRMPLDASKFKALLQRIPAPAAQTNGSSPTQ